MPTLDFWFDYSCPYAYVAAMGAEAVAARAGATLRWRPFLLGGVFAARATPQNLAAGLPPVKARYLLADQARLADRAGVPLRHPPEHPRRTVAALRATLARGMDPDLIRALYRAYWVEGRAVEDEAVVREIAGPVDLDAQREPLRRLTDQAIRLGVFGAPAWVLWNGAPDDEEAGFRLWWGGDRAPLVEAAGRAAAGLAPLPAEGPPPPAVPGAAVDVWFDYSSPFAYLGVMHALARLPQARLRPMLLGALFKAVGQPNVPLFSFNDAKRAWYLRDLTEQAERWGIPFAYNAAFPVRTVLPLRLTLAHPDPVGFTRAVFRATWAEDRDPADLAVLRACGAAAALPPGVPDTDEALLAVAEEQKNRLFANTTEAVETGLFGAPSFVVRRPGLAPLVFWGQDRLDQVEAALGGWTPPDAAEAGATG